MQGVRTFIIIKTIRELRQAQKESLCRHIILEDNNVIYIWNRFNNKWVKNVYVLFYESKEKDFEATGLKAYQEFYKYCGKEKVEEMKKVYSPIDIWESYEQLHYSNVEFINEKIYQNIYEFDCNSSFTFGVLQLPNEFNILKEYMLSLYDKKKNASCPQVRGRYKNLQNYLIGYFARIKEFVKVRSEIIRFSNHNIRKHIAKIIKAKGIVYISSTDSIITNQVGYEVMQEFISDDVGKFKLEKSADKLFYKSSNAYQIGDKVVWSGMKYFAKKNSDFFNDIFAEQTGNFFIPFDYKVDIDDNNTYKLCKVKLGEIKVDIYNILGEQIQQKIYKIQGDIKNGFNGII